jgi:ankyrin repeat protein
MKKVKRILVVLALLLFLLSRSGAFYLFYASRTYNTPLGGAAGRGDLQAVQALLAKGASINQQPRGMNGWTPLVQAIWGQHTNVAYFLLEKGADPNIKDHQGVTALWYAIARGDSNTNLVRVLIARGADVNARDIDGNTLLQIATGNGHREIAKLLQEAGAKVTVTGVTGVSP